MNEHGSSNYFENVTERWKFDIGKGYIVCDCISKGNLLWAQYESIDHIDFIETHSTVFIQHWDSL